MELRSTGENLTTQTYFRGNAAQCEDITHGTDKWIWFKIFEDCNVSSIISFSIVNSKLNKNILEFCNKITFDKAQQICGPALNVLINDEDKKLIKAIDLFRGCNTFQIDNEESEDSYEFSGIDIPLMRMNKGDTMELHETNLKHSLEWWGEVNLEEVNKWVKPIQRSYIGIFAYESSHMKNSCGYNSAERIENLNIIELFGLTTKLKVKILRDWNEVRSSTLSRDGNFVIDFNYSDCGQGHAVCISNEPCVTLYPDEKINIIVKRVLWSENLDMENDLSNRVDK